MSLRYKVFLKLVPRTMSPDGPPIEHEVARFKFDVWDFIEMDADGKEMQRFSLNDHWSIVVEVRSWEEE